MSSCSSCPFKILDLFYKILFEKSQLEKLILWAATKGSICFLSAKRKVESLLSFFDNVLQSGGSLAQKSATGSCDVKVMLDKFRPRKTEGFSDYTHLSY